jgi:hypothetical protein
MPRCLWPYCVSNLVPTVRDMAGFFGPAQLGRLLRLLRSRRRGGDVLVTCLPAPPGTRTEEGWGGPPALVCLPRPFFLFYVLVRWPASVVSPGRHHAQATLCCASPPPHGRARSGLRTVGMLLGVSVRIELRHGSLSSPPARSGWGHGPDGHATLWRAQGPCRWEGT